MSFSVYINQSKTYPSIILKDDSLKTFAEVFCFGGLLNSFSIEQNGKLFNIVDAYTDTDDAIAKRNTWFKSCRLSPFPCRLKDGVYEWQNQQYKIDKFYLGDNALHGIIYDAVYDIIRTEANEQFALVELSYDYKGYDKGYPFEFITRLIWKLEADNLLSVSSYVTNKSNTAIPYCEGWHPYFKLDVPVDDCMLQFNASRQIEFDSSCIPTGKLIEEKRFKQPTFLKNIFLDNCFMLDENTKEPKCILKGNQFALSIITAESYPYLQIFTPDHRENIAIENLSAAPDAFNNKIGLQYLQPNKEYHYKTSYQLEKIS
jgi:aldose 1-epimerase